MSLEPHYFAPDDMQKQLRYEQDMQEEGIAAHRASVQKARDAGRESSTSSGTYLLRHILNPSPARREEGYRPFNEVIQEFIDKSYSGKSGG